MKKIFIFLILVNILVTSCSNQKETLHERITANENLIRQKFKEGISDTTLMRNLTEDYKTFVEKYPADSLSPQYLYNAARLLVQLKQAREAVELLGKFEKNYTSHKLLPEVIFFRGFVEETELQDIQAAQKTYVKFLQKFPDHLYAEQVRFSLQYLGIEPQKLVEQFKSAQQNKKSP